MQVGDSTAIKFNNPIALAKAAAGNSGNAASDSAVASTSGTNSIVTHVESKAIKNDGKGDNPVNNNLQTALADPNSALARHVLATGRRLETNATQGQKSYNSNDGNQKNLQQLLSQGNSAAATSLALHSVPVDNTRVAIRDDKHLSPKLKKERDGALLAFSSGAVTQPKRAKSSLEDKTHPLAGDKPEKEDGFVSYSLGKAQKASKEVLGALAHFIG